MVELRLCGRGSAPDGELVICARPGTRLSQAIWLSGRIEPSPLCGGLGRCGRCRVQFLSSCPEACEEDLDILGEEAVARGWRLACHCQVPDEGVVRLRLPEPEAGRRLGRGAAPVPGQARVPAGTAAAAACADQAGAGPTAAAGGAFSGEAVLAVDIGTTSIAWRALAADGTILAHGEDLNPQAGAGGDVISRIGLAMQPGGAELLAGLVRNHLLGLMASLPYRVRDLVVAANTAMTEIFLGRDVSGLAGAPYALSVQGNETVHLPGFPPVYLPPLPAPFIGGDITAGLLFLEKGAMARPYLLADLGTNGEIALVRGDGRLFLTSVPLGPSLEGIGLECGALAAADVLTDFTLGPAGLVGVTATGRPVGPGTVPVGISATGYLSLIENLRQLGLMDAEGHLWHGAPPATMMPLARRLLARVETSGRVPRFMVTDSLWLSLHDVEEILKVKAAFGVAVQSLLEAAGLAPGELASLAIAGALGRHVRPRTLETLGFVPAGTAGRVRVVGNSSLEGACLLALDPEGRKELAGLCRDAILLSPATDPSFHASYLAAMRFGK